MGSFTSHYAGTLDVLWCATWCATVPREVNRRAVPGGTLTRYRFTLQIVAGNFCESLDYFSVELRCHARAADLSFPHVEPIRLIASAHYVP